MSQEPKNPNNDEELDDIFLEPDDPDEDDVIALGAEPAAPTADAAEESDDDAEQGEAAEDGLGAELDKLREELAVAQERLLRKAADLENARRRHQREKDELTRYASESVLKDIVPVLDDLERAVAHLEQAGAEASLRDGVTMVARKFAQVLDRRGVKAIDALGAVFDPQFHEAIQQRADETVPHNTVVQEFQRGYLLHDRLLRPALVVVAQGGPPAELADSGDAELDAPSGSEHDEVHSEESGGGSNSSTEPS